MLEVKELYCGYEDIEIVKDVNFKINKGENLCIVGPNGCGKSTLLKAISNLIDYKGKIYIENIEISSLSRKELSRKVGLMSQNSELYFPYSVYDTVAVGRYSYNKGLFFNLSQEDKNIILESIKEVGLLEYKDKMINELSGGQLQRVFLARIFAQNPDIILLDEPTNHLDLKHQIELLEYLDRWTKENNKIVIAVLHDLNLVQHIADNILLMDKGKIISYGKSENVFKDEILKSIYGLDIKKFMINILKKWEQN